MRLKWIYCSLAVYYLHDETKQGFTSNPFDCKSRCMWVGRAEMTARIIVSDLQDNKLGDRAYSFSKVDRGDKSGLDIERLFNLHGI